MSHAKSTGAGRLQTLGAMLLEVANDYAEETALFRVAGVELVCTTELEQLSRDEVREGLLRGFLYGDRHSPPKLSIVIPVHGAPTVLSACLRSIARQSLVEAQNPQVQVVVVENGVPMDSLSVFDNASVKAALVALAARDVDVTSCRLVPNQRRATARNVGLSKAKHPVVFFIDGSMVLDRDFLAEHMLRHCRTSNRPVALLGFKENLRWIDYEQQLSVIERGIRRPDFRNDIKVRHTLKPDELPVEHLGRRYTAGDEISYMDLTNYLNGFGGTKAVGFRTLPTFFQTNIVSVRRDLVCGVGGFDPEFQTWGFEDTYVGALLAVNGCKLIPCPSSVAFNVDPPPPEAQSELSPTKKAALVLEARSRYSEVLQTTLTSSCTKARFRARVRSASPSVHEVQLEPTRSPSYQHAARGGAAARLQAEYAKLLEPRFGARARWRYPHTHPAFGDVLTQITPDEARILVRLPRKGLHEPIGHVVREVEGAGVFNVTRNVSLLGEDAGCEHLELVPLYIDNLCRLGLTVIPDGCLFDDWRYIRVRSKVATMIRNGEILLPQGSAPVIEQHMIGLTDFGEAFLRTVYPRTALMKPH